MDFSNKLPLLLFGVILAVPPVLAGGRDIRATLLLFSLLLPLAYFVWRSGVRVDFGKGKIPFLFFMGFIGMAAIALWYSPERYEALEKLLHFLGYALLFFLSFLFFDSAQKIRTIAYIVLGIGVGIALWGLYDFYFSHQFGVLRLASPFYSHIPYAEFIIYPLFLTTALLLFKPLKRQEAIALVLVNALFLVTFFFAHSRGAWLSFAVALFLFALLFWKLVLRKETVLALGATLLLAGAGITGMQYIKSQQAATVSRQTPEISVQATYDSPEFAENALVARLMFWQRAGEIFLDRPIGGAGLGSFANMHKQYLKPPFFYSADPHNFYLKVLAEMGFVGFALFMGFVGSLLYSGFRLLRTIKERFVNHTKTTHDIMLLGIMGGVGAALVHNAMNFGWLFGANMIIFFMAAGIVLRQYAQSRKGRAESGSAQKLLWPALFGIGGILLVAGWLLFLGDTAFQQGNLDEALLWNPVHPQYNGAKAAILHMVSPQKASESIHTYMRKSLQWSKNSATFLLQGDVYLARENQELAEESFRQAIDANPSAPEGYEKLARLYLEQNRLQEIHALLEPLLRQYKKEYMLSPLYIVRDKNVSLSQISNLHILNGSAYLQEQNEKGAQQEFQKALHYVPGQETKLNRLIDQLSKTRGF